jgi:gliding motility-associated lipoprotein GldD
MISRFKLNLCNVKASRRKPSLCFDGILKILPLLFVLFLFLPLLSCDNGYVPKPRGYYRIDLPEHQYRLFDTTYPYTFEYPVYARICRDSSDFSEPYWLNVVYPMFHAQLHLSYKKISNNLPVYIEDARKLVNKHIPKANAIEQREYLDPAHRVFGLVYDIRGSDAASSYQFYLTDSTSNFVRAALYFNLIPNNDSLLPVINFLRADLEKMISTFRWKKP